MPLGPLVADVVASAPGLRARRRRPAPDVYLGPLPEVEADPAMLRHVIDNLIGNALKYVPAGRAPRIDMTAGPAGAGLDPDRDRRPRASASPTADKPDDLRDVPPGARPPPATPAPAWGWPSAGASWSATAATSASPTTPAGVRASTSPCRCRGGRGDHRPAGREQLERALAERAAVEGLVMPGRSITAVRGARGPQARVARAERRRRAGAGVAAEPAAWRGAGSGRMVRPAPRYGSTTRS